MYGFALLVAVSFFLFHVNQKRRAAQPVSARPVTRAEVLGDAGEAIVDAELRRVLTWLCGENFYLHAGAVVLHHAPGTDYPTAEIDHLAITPFGLFVFETKNWTGRIEPGPDVDTLTRIAADGTRDDRKSPIRQNRSKLAFLRSVLPGMWPVSGYGAFASAGCVLSPALPPTLICLADLSHQLRLCKTHYESTGQRPVNVALAWRAVLSVAQTSPSAVAEHRCRVQTSDKSRHAFSSR
ncbi:nuclease-related domain-containing protein [Paraburkholderia sp. BCC1876]|uniref:nuclease-related domain-containing protein n=1 Tax=Paraburkholderia sp. BCC1876 TaxID=2676303 RepID=UPI0015928D24|nr:nuclease-related domain-containing protein [Paraburkholderia sp. BCC1876]